MHEWALAESVIKTVETKPELKNKKIKVLLGELQDIDEEIFSFAMDELLKQRKSDIKYSIVVDEAAFKCNECGREFFMSEITKKSKAERENIHFIPEMVKAFVKCPGCGSIDFDIVRGRGVMISYE